MSECLTDEKLFEDDIDSIEYKLNQAEEKNTQAPEIQSPICHFISKTSGPQGHDRPPMPLRLLALSACADDTLTPEQLKQDDEKKWEVVEPRN